MPQTDIASVALIPRAHLFGNPTKTYGQISPDGRFVAWMAPVAGVLNVWVGPTEAPEGARPVTDDKKRGIRFYRWTYDGKHLLYIQDVDGDENFHIYAVDPDERATRDLTPFDGVQARISGFSRKIRDRVLISLNRRDRRFHDLYTVEIATARLAMVEENPGLAGFYTDDHFVARLAEKFNPDGTREVLHKSADGSWGPWISFSPEDARTSGPQHLDADGKAVFFSDSRGRDTAALTRIDLATGKTNIMAAHERADIGGTVDDIETHEPVAYTVTVERTEYFALDPRVQADLDFLSAQGIGDWDLNSRTEDDRFWLVAGSSDVRPGVGFLYDRHMRTIRELYRSRPELADAPLVRMHPKTIRSRDGLDLVCYLSLPQGADRTEPGVPDQPQPMVLVVHGGPWGRDMFGYHSWHQWLANRGYAVLSVNFRGSTGFGKAFVNAGDHEWGRKMDDDLLDAVAWAIASGIADPRRVAIMGGSYGGYATLVGVTRNPELYACGIDVVGPSNLETLLRTIPPYWEAIRSELYRAIGDPDTPEGLRLAHERSPLFHAERIKRPLLIAQGANDPRVKQAESDQMVAAMTARGVPVTYVLFPDEGHGFARPGNNIAFVAIAESFLARHLGGRAEPVTPEEMRGANLRVMEGIDGIDWPAPAGAGG